MKKILVIDDHPAVMEGTKTILETDTNLSVDCLSPDASEHNSFSGMIFQLTISY